MISKYESTFRSNQYGKSIRIKFSIILLKQKLTRIHIGAPRFLSIPRLQTVKNHFSPVFFFAQSYFTSLTAMSKSQHDTLCLAGTLLSTYALYVKYAHQADNSFTPLIGSTVAFSSEFGKGLGGLVKGENLIANVSNSTLGICHYILMFFISQVYGENDLWKSLTFSRIRLALSLASGLPCFWLAYVLMFILQDTCSICITMYGVNAMLIWVNYQGWSEASKNSNKNKRD